MNVSLASRTIGSGSRLVLLHGFSQNSACWGPFADRLATHHEVILVDAPGHGESRHDTADLEEAARLSVEVGGDAIYVGYSMGGRVALHAALAEPDRIRALVLIGATAGIDDPAERAARRRADEALADHLSPHHAPNSGGFSPGGGENPPKFGDGDGLEAFLDWWLAQPMFATLPPAAQHRAARLRNRPEGLAASLWYCGTGTQRPSWDDLAGMSRPTLAIAGAEDPKFTAVAQRLAAAIGPAAATAIIPGAGHSAHLERPDETADAVLAFTTGLGSEK